MLWLVYRDLSLHFENRRLDIFYHIEDTIKCKGLQQWNWNELSNMSLTAYFSLLSVFTTQSTALYCQTPKAKQRNETQTIYEIYCIFLLWILFTNL